jgi:hypothetical protein
MNSHIVAALACLALANGAQAVDKAAVRETIEVKTGAGKVLVQLFAENTSGKTVYLPRALYSEEELFHSPFELSSGGFTAAPGRTTTFSLKYSCESALSIAFAADC